jgi:DNA polymerase V
MSGLPLHSAAIQPPPRTFPLMAHRVRAGFPSPAGDYVERRIDLNRELIQHPEATFFLRAQGNSMIGAGIGDGDTLIVDRAIEPNHNHIVIATVDGEFTVKRLYKLGEQIMLMAENPDFPPIELNDGQEMAVWGVVTHIIKKA